MVLTTVPQPDYDKSRTTRKNVRRGTLRPQQKADLRSLRLAFIATLPHGKETHGFASGARQASKTRQRGSAGARAAFTASTSSADGSRSE